jgi:hypothetical protein
MQCPSHRDFCSLNRENLGFESIISIPRSPKSDHACKNQIDDDDRGLGAIFI